MIEQYFNTLTDKRQKVKIKHNLLEIIIMVICVIIADWKSIEALIEDFLPETFR